MVLSALFVFPTLLSSRASTRDLLLRLSKALVILTASDFFEQREEIPHLRAGRQREASVLFKRQEEVPHLRAGRQREASVLFKRQEEVPHLRAGRQREASDLFEQREEVPHLRAGRQREASVLFQTGEFVSLDAFFCEYICPSAAAMISSSLCMPFVRTAKP